MGEMSLLLLLLLGGLFLLVTKVISWHTPVAMFASMAVFAGVFHALDPDKCHASVLTHLFSGGFVLGAFFIATDYVTQPVSNAGRLIFGAGVGMLTFFIRDYSIFPEGVAFSILLMNAMTPLIDHYIKPRIFGRTRSGKPLPNDPAAKALRRKAEHEGREQKSCCSRRAAWGHCTGCGVFPDHWQYGDQFGPIAQRKHEDLVRSLEIVIPATVCMTMI